MNEEFKKLPNKIEPDLNKVIDELDELKNIALNCFDKNGNPNVSAAIKALQCKAKILSDLKGNKKITSQIVQMGEVKIDGVQLKLNIGEDIKEID